MSTTFTVYAFICQSNGKAYIGVTNDFEARKQGHFAALKTGFHHNRALQKCYQEYGKDSFVFQILETDIDESIKFSRENYWIKTFNSIENGFNVVSPSHVWNGVTYETLEDAARALGISSRGLSQRYRQRYKSDADMLHPELEDVKPQKERQIDILDQALIG